MYITAFERRDWAVRADYNSRRRQCRYNNCDYWREIETPGDMGVKFIITPIAPSLAEPPPATGTSSPGVLTERTSLVSKLLATAGRSGDYNYFDTRGERIYTGCASWTRAHIIVLLSHYHLNWTCRQRRWGGGIIRS